MTLRSRFIIFLALFCFAVVMNILAANYYSSYQVGRAVRAFENSFAENAVLDATQAAVDAQRAMLREAFEGRRPPQEVAQTLREGDIEIRAYLDRLMRSTPEIMSGLTQRYAAYCKTVEQFVVAADQPDWLGQLDPDFEGSYRRRYQALTSGITGLHDLRRRAGATSAAAVNVGRVLSAMAAAELLILVVTLSLFSRWILKPIAEIRLATEQIAGGNLEYRLQLPQGDELGALGEEVNRMAGSLAVAQRELKQQERLAAMGEMVSVVAHNIRNPLAGIRATAQTSMHAFEADSPARGQQERIIKSVDSLEQWLKELLHLNRPIDLRLERTSIDELFADLIQIFLPATQRKQVTIDYAPHQPDQNIEVDRQHFVQAVASILDNAIEASPAGSGIRIETGQGSVGAREFFIEISDAGSGVPETLRRAIFDAHFSTKPGGTGIGLSMAKKIIEAHSGRISVAAGQSHDPALPAGAVFRITLPHRHNGGEVKHHGEPGHRG